MRPKAIIYFERYCLITFFVNVSFAIFDVASNFGSELLRFRQHPIIYSIFSGVFGTVIIVLLSGMPFFLALTVSRKKFVPGKWILYIITFLCLISFIGNFISRGLLYVGSLQTLFPTILLSLSLCFLSYPSAREWLRSN